MATTKFYVYTDDAASAVVTSESIKERFEQDYPDAEFNTDFDGDEELFTITFTTESDAEEVDTFLCEEICQEHEYYCSISDGTTTKEYYFDEEDEWIYKN